MYLLTCLVHFHQIPLLKKIIKKMKYLILFLTYLPAVQFIPSILIMVKAKPMMDNMAKLNTGSFIKKNFFLTGLVKVILLALYFTPATSPIGFFLLCSWFGAMIAIHFSSEDSPLFTTIFLITLWVSAYFMDPELFVYIKCLPKLM